MSSYFRQDCLKTPDGASIYFQVQGEGGPAMVLCDGIGCDGFAWKYLLPKLKQNNRVLRWHYRGHGQSGLPDDMDRVSIDQHCEDLDRIMESVGIDNAIVFGHSMGVQVSLEFHRRFSKRVKGLVLLCGSYGNPLDTFHDGPLLKLAFPFLYKAVDKYPNAARIVTKLAMSSEAAIRFALLTELNRELMRREDLIPYFDHLAKMDPVVFMRTLQWLAEHSAWDHLPHIDVPTLVIGGEKDTFTPVWLSRRMASAIPDAELIILPGGSHTAPLEHPDLVWDRVERFLHTRVLGQAREHATSSTAA